MVPSDYRLEQVCARLVERLEGERRSFAGNPEKAPAAFRRSAEEHVTAAVGEYRHVAVAEDPEPHARFLRRTVLETFLPRYERLAVAMTQGEESGFGFGRAAQPAGRIALMAGAIVLLVVLLRFLYLPWVWPLVVLDLSLPFWPDLLALLAHARYRRDLQAALVDMASLQEQSEAYLPPEALHTGEAPETEPNATRRTRDKETP